MAIACYATGCDRRPTTTCAASSTTSRSSTWKRRPPRRTKNGWLGKDILGSGIDIDIHNVLGAGAYICGEETALMESLEGKKGQPRYKPPFPANFGLYGKPTTINNTETYASVPAIIRNGAEWFLNLGKPNNGGPKVFSVSGHVAKPGNYEIRLGTRVRRSAADGRRRAQRPQAQGGDPRRLVDAGAAGRHDDGADDGLRRAAEGRFGPGLRRRHRHGRNHLHGARLPAHRALLLRRIAAASARPAAKAPAGCTACSRASSMARRRWTTCRCCAPPRARSKATPSAHSAKPRRGRCRGSCATSGTNSNTRSSTSASWSTTSAPARVVAQQVAA